MGPDGHLDVLGDLGVPGDRPVMLAIQPDDLGQHVRIRRMQAERESRRAG
jgi:hypothetical protein